MKHHQQNSSLDFVHTPADFRRDSERDFLQYCLGATLYMPGTKDFTQSILTRKLPELASMVMCFEDSIAEEDVPQAEENALAFLASVCDALDGGTADPGSIPLIFFRPRNPAQLAGLLPRLEPRFYRILAGFTLPKFNSACADEYISLLEAAGSTAGLPVYALPILEGTEIAHKETRMEELLRVKEALDAHKDIFLNVRVGGTDFSACFGVRRSIDFTIYDILTVRDCLLDILNVFSRNNDYVVSGPVWEYFLAQKSMKFQKETKSPVHDALFTHEPVINKAVDGLLRESMMDLTNGFVGKTAIHPTHIKFINALHTVSREEYDDAMQVLGSPGGVVKSANANKMNETKPHTNWARKIAMRAKAFGVVEDSAEFLKRVATDS